MTGRLGIVGSRCSGWRCTWRRTGRWCCPTPLQTSNHSAAVHRRQPVPIRSHAASASSLVTFDQGSRPATEHGRRVGVEAVVGAGGVVARRLVSEHRDVAGRVEDQLVVGGAFGHRIQLVDLAVAVVVEAVADLGPRRLRRAHAAAVAGHGVVADPGAGAGAGARADGARLCRCRTARRRWPSQSLSRPSQPRVVSSRSW